MRRHHCHNLKYYISKRNHFFRHTNSFSYNKVVRTLTTIRLFYHRVGRTKFIRIFIYTQHSSQRNLKFIKSQYPRGISFTRLYSTDVSVQKGPTTKALCVVYDFSILDTLLTQIRGRCGIVCVQSIYTCYSVKLKACLLNTEILKSRFRLLWFKNKKIASSVKQQYNCLVNLRPNKNK